MQDLSEQTWKLRYVRRLAALFILQGVDAKSAIADAEAHCEHCYPLRGTSPPEAEADRAYEGLRVDAGS